MIAGSILAVLLRGPAARVPRKSDLNQKCLLWCVDAHTNDSVAEQSQEFHLSRAVICFDTHGLGV